MFVLKHLSENALSRDKGQKKQLMYGKQYTAYIFVYIENYQ